MLTTLISAADPSLGRADPSCFSDQTRMEMLIDGLTSVKRKFLDANGDIKDVRDWNVPYQIDVQLRDDRVVDVTLRYIMFEDRQFPFECIPPLVEDFCVTNCDLHGTLETSHLPPNLTGFDISFNQLKGELNFATFPRGLAEISIGRNEFCGSVVLSDLPDSIIKFDARRNEFSGGLSFANLPEMLAQLFLQDNRLTGEIHIEKLPQAMIALDLSSNLFTGDFRLLEVPPHLLEIRVSQNRLSGTAVLPEASGIMRFLFICNDMKEVVDAKGNKHVWEGAIVGQREIPIDRNVEIDLF